MKKFLVLIEMASENGLWRGFAPDFEKLEAEAATPEELLSKLREALGERLERLREAGEAEPEPMPLECVPMPESFHDWRLARVEPGGTPNWFIPATCCGSSGTALIFSPATRRPFPSWAKTLRM